MKNAENNNDSSLLNRMKNRRLNRLANYDYSQQGMYFVTTCTKDREYLFGEIIDGEMILNDIGKIANNY